MIIRFYWTKKDKKEKSFFPVWFCKNWSYITVGTILLLRIKTCFSPLKGNYFFYSNLNCQETLRKPKKFTVNLQKFSQLLSALTAICRKDDSEILNFFCMSFSFFLHLQKKCKRKAKEMQKKCKRNTKEIM